MPTPFHPSASHISPDYRDGWNACITAQSGLVTDGEVAAALSAHGLDVTPYAQGP